MRPPHHLLSCAALIGASLLGFSAASPVAAQQTPARPGAPPAPAQPGLTVTLLGTAGGPPPHLNRSQPATLLQVDNRSYLIDAGEGAARQLLRAGVPSPRLSAAFISHLHWDHTLGLGYLMATGWMMGRTAPMEIWGPPGLADFVDRTATAVGLGEDIFRAQATTRPALRSLYPAKQIDLTGPTEIYRDDKVRVTAAPNSHFALIHGGRRSYGEDKAYSYRFDTAHGSVVFTGDTGVSDALTALAKGADVLVAEICDFDSMRVALERSQGPGANLDALMTHMQRQHLSPEDVGKLATEAKVKKVVLTHYVIGADFDPQAFAAQVRKFYPNGEIVVGQDLTKVQIVPAR